MASTTIPQMRLNAHRGPQEVYTWLMNTGPRIRAALPDAVNQPMYTPCGTGRGKSRWIFNSGLVILKTKMMPLLLIYGKLKGITFHLLFVN